MRWIRGPAWDLVWVWSGLPVGLALALTAWLCWQPQGGFRGTIAEEPLYWFFALVVMLETGHVISPIVLVWSHRNLRQLAWQRRGRFIWLALAAFVPVLAVGVATRLGWTSFTPGLHQIFRVTNWSNPLPIVVWIYLVWNAYHFGMQSFGIVSLYKRRNGMRRRRWLDMGLFCGGTALLIALGRIADNLILGFALLGLLSVSHWLQEIGLCGRVSGRPWLFTAVMLGLGAVGFVWLIPTPQGNLMIVMPAIIGVRLGTSFVHFLYDRWIWRLSDPAIRDAIGQDLA